MLRICIAVALLALAGIACARGEEPAVHVSALRDPVDKSYRKLLEGMATFERARSLAPQASLRFRLLTRKPGATLDGITLRIVGDTVSLPVPIAPDRSFTVAPDQAAYDEDASMVLNRKNDTVTWRAQVLSPGVPAGARRLGDMRLECRVGVVARLVSKGPLLVELFRSHNPDQCASRDVRYFQFSDRPIFGVSMEAGGRKRYLPFGDMYCGAPGLLKRGLGKILSYFDCQALPELTFVLPLWDSSWPDDTLVRFDYMDDPAPAGQEETVQAMDGHGKLLPLHVVAGESSVAALRAQAEPVIGFSFADQRQVLRYRIQPSEPDAPDAKTHHMAELVVLADAQGVVRKLRRYEWEE